MISILGDNSCCIYVVKFPELVLYRSFMFQDLQRVRSLAGELMRVRWIHEAGEQLALNCKGG